MLIRIPIYHTYYYALPDMPGESSYTFDRGKDSRLVGTVILDSDITPSYVDRIYVRGMGPTAIVLMALRHESGLSWEKRDFSTPEGL